MFVYLSYSLGEKMDEENNQMITLWHVYCEENK